MFGINEITVEISAADENVMMVEVTAPVGTLTVLGNVYLAGRTLHIDRAHVDGMRPGRLGREGLNTIGRKLLEEADVDETVIEGGARATGPYKGRRPKTIRFPHP